MKRWPAELRRLLKEGVSQNRGLKLFSLGAALLVFAYVRGLEDHQRSVYVDVVALQPADDSTVVLVSEIPARVRLLLHGSRSLLNSLRSEDMRSVQIDLDPARRNYYFDPKDFNLPAGIDIDQVIPASFPLTWVNRESRTRTIRARFAGKLEAGLEVVGKPVVDPPTVVVQGPADEIDGMAIVHSEEIDLVRFGVGKHTVRVRLEDAPPHVRYDLASTVSVTFEVGRELADRRLTGLTIAAVGTDGVVEMRPRRAQVILRGLPAAVEAIDPDSIVPWVDVTGVPAGTASRAVSVRGVPGDVKLIGVEPADVLVTVRGPKRAPR